MLHSVHHCYLERQLRAEICVQVNRSWDDLFSAQTTQQSNGQTFQTAQQSNGQTSQPAQQSNGQASQTAQQSSSFQGMGSMPVSQTASNMPQTSGFVSKNAMPPLPLPTATLIIIVTVSGSAILLAIMSTIIAVFLRRRKGKVQPIQEKMSTTTVERTLSMTDYAFMTKKPSVKTLNNPQRDSDRWEIQFEELTINEKLGQGIHN
jgi:hypothetical protein